MVPVAICLFSTILNYFIITIRLPEFTKSGNFEEERDSLPYFYQAYMPFYTRMSPYGFGMFVAFKHLADSKSNGDVEFLKSWKCVVLEFFSLALILSC
jgi:hypothetical protein